MICFRNFTGPLWEMFGGNLLMFAAIVFYIGWWSVSFWPNGSGRGGDGGLYIAAALFVGAAAIAIISLGINSLSPMRKGFPVVYILVGAAALFIILLAVTKIAFHRAVTSELLLIIFWAALEWSAIAALHGSGRFNMGQVLTLALLVALATVAGLVCYVLHYRLDETSQFWNGLIPLVVDAGVVVVFLVALALSRVDRA